MEIIENIELIGKANSGKTTKLAEYLLEKILKSLDNNNESFKVLLVTDEDTKQDIYTRLKEQLYYTRYAYNVEDALNKIVFYRDTAIIPVVPIDKDSIINSMDYCYNNMFDLLVLDCVLSDQDSRSIVQYANERDISTLVTKQVNAGIMDYFDE